MIWSTGSIVGAVGVALVLGASLGFWLSNKRSPRASDGRLGEQPSWVGKQVVVFVLAAFLLVVGAGWLIYSVTKGSSPDAEIQMGLVVVVAIATMMTLLFIIAVGFRSIDLADQKQPLGLPEGSIRAMISLVLIMVFIIFGIYLFRIVGTGSSTFVGQFSTPPDPKSFGEGRVLIFEKVPNSDLYNVWVVTKISDDGSRLAQQLITTVGTLVVAVAGFYFGSTAVSSAVAATQGVIPSTTSQPVIDRLIPEEGSKGKEITFEIVGRGFRFPKAVRLLRGSETMTAVGDILSSATKIQARISIDKEPDGKWDVVLENEDGKQARLVEVFKIT